MPCNAGPPEEAPGLVKRQKVVRRERGSEPGLGFPWKVPSRGNSLGLATLNNVGSPRAEACSLIVCTWPSRELR